MFLYAAASVPRPQDLTSNDPVARTKAELDVSNAKQIDSSFDQYGGYKVYVHDASHMDFMDHSLVSPWRNWRERGHIRLHEYKLSSVRMSSLFSMRRFVGKTCSTPI